MKKDRWSNYVPDPVPFNKLSRRYYRMDINQLRELVKRVSEKKYKKKRVEMKRLKKSIFAITVLICRVERGE
jgi:hypothetical protein